MLIPDFPKTLLIFSAVSLGEATPWTVRNPGDVVIEDSQPEGSYEPGYDLRSYNYAWNFPYRYRPRSIYMERKVYDTVSRGSVYVEGLKRALQAYVDRLRSCARLDRKEPTAASETACRNSTREHVRARRLAQLALWATRQIRKGPHGQLSDPDEVKSLIRLAGLLDQLAELTGYEPKPEDFLVAATTALAPSTEVLTFPPLLEAASFNVSDDVIASMVNCLDKSNNDSRPAYERCPRAPIPAALQALFNITDSSAGDDFNMSSTDTPTAARRKKSISTYFETIDNPSDKKTKRQSSYPPKVVEHRLPEDPYQDISRFSKSKEGTNIMPNPEQAILVRLALERHFNNPDMETVRRYGSNYNPLIQNAPLAGILRTLLDI